MYEIIAVVRWLIKSTSFCTTGPRDKCQALLASEVERAEKNGSQAEDWLHPFLSLLYIYIYVYTYTSISISIYPYICLYLPIHIHTCIHLCLCLCLCLCLSLSLCMHVDIDMGTMSTLYIHHWASAVFTTGATGQGQARNPILGGAGLQAWWEPWGDANCTTMMMWTEFSHI